MEQQIVEIIKMSPVMGAMLYMIFLYGRALADKDRRIDQLIDRCIGVKPCDDNQNVDTDNK